MFGWRGAQIETIYLGDRKLSVRTSVLEEKATACNMLCCYADELKEGFYPFVEQVRPDSTSCLHATFLTCFAYSIHQKCSPCWRATMQPGEGVKRQMCPSVVSLAMRLACKEHK